MKDLFHDLWTNHRRLTISFGLAAAFALFFALLSLFFWLDWDGPRRDAPTDMPVAAWMTPRMIGQSWDVPREEMMRILELEENRGPGRPQNLAEIAAAKGMTVEDLIAQTEAGITAFRVDHPPRGDDAE